MDLDKIIQRLKDSEGTGPMKNGNFMLYRDTKGIWTIGYGYNIQVHGLPPAIVERLLVDKLMEAHKALVLRFPGFNQLDPVRQSVLLDMTYNMGNAWFHSWPIFQGQVLRREWAAAARNMRSTKWYDDVGPRRADPLIRKMETGVDA